MKHEHQEVMASLPPCARGQLGTLLRAFLCQVSQPALQHPAQCHTLPSLTLSRSTQKGPASKSFSPCETAGVIHKVQGVIHLPPLPEPPAGSSYPSPTWYQPPPPSCAGTQRQMSVPAEQARCGGNGWQFNDPARHCLANAISRAAGRSQAGHTTAAPPAQLRLFRSSCAAQMGWEGCTPSAPGVCRDPYSWCLCAVAGTSPPSSPLCSAVVTQHVLLCYLHNKAPLLHSELYLAQHRTACEMLSTSYPLPVSYLSPGDYAEQLSPQIPARLCGDMARQGTQELLLRLPRRPCLVLPSHGGGQSRAGSTGGEVRLPACPLSCMQA